MKRLLVPLLTLVLALVMSGFAFAQDTEFAFIRFAHDAPELGAAYLLVNDTATEVQSAEYRDVSEWYRVRANTAFTFSAGRVGADAIYRATKRLAPGSYTTLTLEVGPSGRATLLAEDAPARVRVVHLAQGTGAVDVFVNGELSPVQALAFGNASGWVALPAGGVTFGAGATGGDPRYTLSARLVGGTWNTVAAITSPDGARVQLRLLTEDYGILDPNLARVTVLHAIPGLLPVNVNVDGGTFIQNLGFPGALGNNDGADAFEVNAGPRDIQVTSTLDPAQVFFDLEDVTLFGGRAYFIAAYGLAGTPQLLVINTVPGEVEG
jgi:hypothetical protein